MAVETTSTSAYSVGNGVTTTFSLPFYFIDPAHIVITLNGVVQTGGYSVAGTRVPAGGTVTITPAPGVGVLVGRQRIVPITQPIDTQNNQTIFEDVFDDGLDRRCMVEQQLESEIQAVEESIASIANLIGTGVPLIVKSATQATQPGTPSNGDAYLVPVAGWSALHANTIAVYLNGAWNYIIASDQQQVVTQDSKRAYVFNGGLGKWRAVRNVDAGQFLKGDGTNETAALQAVIDFNPNTVITIPADLTVKITQVTMSAPGELRVNGWLQPFSNPGSYAPAVILASDGAGVTGQGGFDGISSSYSNWSGPAADCLRGFYEGVFCEGFVVKNMGLNGNAYAAVSFAQVKHGRIKRIRVTNCGPVAFVASGTAIYTQNCVDCKIELCFGDTIGGIFFNDSCGLRNVVEDCSANYVTTFPYKGGYGSGLYVSADVVPTTSTFSVPNSIRTLAQLDRGKYLFIKRPVFEGAQGRVKSAVVSNDETYITVTMEEAMAVAPVADDEVQALTTDLTFRGTRHYMSGGHGYDLNGQHNTRYENCSGNYDGMLKIGGVFSGFTLGAFWNGYDAQDAYNYFSTYGAKIIGARMSNCYACCADFDSTNNYVSVDDYQFREWNLGNVSGIVAIRSNQLSFFRSKGNRIGNGTAVSAKGGPLSSYFSDGDVVDGMVFDCEFGMLLGSQNNAVIQNNIGTARSTADGAFVLKIADGGGNASNSVHIRHNYGKLTAASWASGSGFGYGFLNEDSDSDGIYYDADNQFYAPSATTKFYEAASSSTGSTLIDTGAGANGGFVRKNSGAVIVADAGVVRLKEWGADAGTFGGVRVQGTAWDVTTGFGEMFTVDFYGDTGSNGRVFTSIANKGGTVVTDTMFTVAAGSAANSLVAKFTNSSGNTIRLTLDIAAFDRE